MIRSFILSTAFLLLITSCAFGKFIRVGIFSNVNSTKYVFIAANSDFTISGDHGKLIHLKSGESVIFELMGNYVELKHKGEIVPGSYSKIKFTAVDSPGFFRLKSMKPETQAWPLYEASPGQRYRALARHTQKMNSKG